MIQNIMIAAKERGLYSCPQAAWNHFHPIVLDVLNAPEDKEKNWSVPLPWVMLIRMLS